MSTLKQQRIVLLGMIFLLALCSALWAALPVWSVQGVIDWSAPDLAPAYGPAGVSHRVYDGNWHVLDHPPLSAHGARDGFVLLPRDEDFNTTVPLGTLAGAAGMIVEYPIDPDWIDWYEIWSWVDVNLNGEADAGDKIDGQTPQDWVCLFHKQGPPAPFAGQYDTLTGEANIVNLLPSVHYWHTGVSYLLLLRVHAHVPPEQGFAYTDASNLQFQGGVTRVGEKIFVSYTELLPEEGWASNDEVHPDRKYVSKMGNTAGVDDSEVLWVRVNNPPRAPRY